MLIAVTVLTILCLRDSNRSQVQAFIEVLLAPTLPRRIAVRPSLNARPFATRCRCTVPHHVNHFRRDSVAQKKIENLPLREKLNAAERLARELKEHLEQAVLPRSNDLRRLVRRRDNPDESVTDKTVRNSVDQVFATEEYTTKLVEELFSYLDMIDRELKQLVDDGQPV